jgi:uncharacterized protein (DUF488 family)
MQNIDIEVFTIGHGRRTIEEFTSLLSRNEISILIDVRSYPYSRFNSQFRQSNLQISLNNAGITYLWLGKQLGGRPENPNLYNNGKLDYVAIKNTIIFKSGIQQVLRFAHENIKVTLMCSESDPNDCHRKHLLANELSSGGVTVLHINKVGNIEQHINSQSLFS